MDKIPDEILLIGVILLVVKVASMVRALLPYDSDDTYCHDLGDYDAGE
jgi:hypothetical protein